MGRARSQVEVFQSGDLVMQAAADVLVQVSTEAIRATGRFTVALAGGSTPIPLYSRLAEASPGRIDWEHVHVFWSDERCVPPEDPASNYRMARKSLLDRVPLPKGNVHRMRGDHPPAQAAHAYERELRAAFATPEGQPRPGPRTGLDLVLLGMGADGHTASLFPGTAAIGERERWVAAVAVGSAWRLSMTPHVINAASEVVFLVVGGEKASTLRRVLEDPYQPDTLPAQAIALLAGRLRWLVDASAAAELRPC